MGIQGAMSLLEEDPQRFGRRWTCNWETDEEEEEVGADQSSNKKMKEEDKEEKEEASKTVKPSRQPLIVLVDGMGLMYHVNRNQLGSDMCPAIIRGKVSDFLFQFLQALPPGSELRIFMDGIAPTAKLPAQVERLKKQAIQGDTLAKRLEMETTNDDAVGGSTAGGSKILHLLAEWALVEAIQGLNKKEEKEKWGGGDGEYSKKKILELHRPSRGEAEAYIDYWISRKIPPATPKKVCVLADDTDFLVYHNCPGFISFRSLIVQQDEDEDDKEGGEIRLSGFEYERQKFLETFLPPKVNKDDVMTVVAALVGCDYSLQNPDSQRGVERALNKIVKSDIGGLKPKARKNPSKAQKLTATLRFVAHYMKLKGDDWVEPFCAAVAVPPTSSYATNSTTTTTTTTTTKVEANGGGSKDRAASVLKEAFVAIHKIYFRGSLTLPNKPSFEIKPTSMEVRRLLEYGILYCRPIIESWETPSSNGIGGGGAAAAPAPTSRKRSLEEVNSALLDSSSFAVVIAPPFTRQIAGCMAEDSIWRVPHFHQARMRLYCLLVQFARTGGAYSFEGGQLRLSPMWTNDKPKVTEYVRSNSSKNSIRMQEKEVHIPSYDCISAWGDEAELLSGEEALDRACLFCILGNIKQAKPALNPCLRSAGMLFLSSILLPFNLALLLILLGTSPEVEDVEAMSSDYQSARKEIKRALPLMSVACYHAILISNTLVSLFGTQSEEHQQSNLTFLPSEGRSKAFEVSDVLNLEKAVWVWNAVRQGADLEQSHSNDSDDASEMEVAMAYLDEAMDRLGANLPQTSEWDAKTKDWKYRAKVLWVIWWEVFNVALTSGSNADSSTKELNEWDKYILLLSKS